LVIEQNWVDEIAVTLPELPDEKKARFIALGLSAYDSSVLVSEKESADYFDALLAAGAEAKSGANWLNNEYFGRLNKAGISISEGPISPERANQLLSLVVSKVISGKIAKELTDIMWDDPRTAEAIVEERGLKQVTDESAIEAAVDKVIAANPDKVEEVKAKPKLAGWFVGQVMKITGGKANPQAVNAVLKRRLDLSDDK